jgi:hypothetical protein
LQIWVIQAEHRLSRAEHIRFHPPRHCRERLGVLLSKEAGQRIPLICSPKTGSFRI